MRTCTRRIFIPAFSFMLLVTSCSSGAPSPPDLSGASRPSISAETTPSVAAKPTRSGDALLFLRGRSIVRRDASSGDESELGRLPSVDAVAAPDGMSIAYVAAGQLGGGGEDFVAQPELHVRSVPNGDDTIIGPGLSPLWDPDGGRVAYLEPQEVRLCEGEVCEGSSSVVVADLAARTRRTVLSPGRWSLLGWLGDALVVADVAGESAVLVVEPKEGPEQLDLVPTEFWGASPNGEWIVASTGRSYELRRVDGGRARPIGLPGGALGSGAWAPTGERLVAVLLRASSSELVEIDTSGRASVLERSSGAEGPVLWSEDGSSFVYVRGAGLRLEAVHCEVDGTCRRLFSWARGVTLLALQNAGV